MCYELDREIVRKKSRLLPRDDNEEKMIGFSIFLGGCKQLKSFHSVLSRRRKGKQIWLNHNIKKPKISKTSGFLLVLLALQTADAQPLGKPVRA